MHRMEVSLGESNGFDQREHISTKSRKAVISIFLDFFLYYQAFSCFEYGTIYSIQNVKICIIKQKYIIKGPRWLRANRGSFL